MVASLATDREPRLPARGSRVATMVFEHRYAVAVRWTGNRGTGTSGYKDYARDTVVSIEGKPDLLGSSDKPFYGDPARWNPEDKLLAALAECHLLSYLHVAVLRGIIVTDYADAATATMVLTGDGGGHFVEAVLRPTVTVSSEDMVEAARDAHAEASAKCFIARSVNFPVRHEPVIQVGVLG